MILLFDDDSTEGKEINADPASVEIVLRTRSPLAINQVLRIVSHVRQIIRDGLGVARFCPDRREESERMASCAAATLGVPVAAVVGEIARLDWIDFGIFMQSPHDFLDAWNEREHAA